MTIAPIITGGFSGGVKYIPTLGYLGGATPPSFAVVDTFLPRKKPNWKKYREEKGEIRKQLEALYYGISEGFEVKPDEKNAILEAVTRNQEINYQAFLKNQQRWNLLISAYERLLALKRAEIDKDDEDAILLLM